MTLFNIKKAPGWPLVLLLILSTVAALSIWRHVNSASGHIQLRVVDAYSMAPLEGARISIPSQDRYAATDSSGSVSFMGLTIRKNPALPSIAGQEVWGECTILATKDGYRPTVLFYGHIHKNQLRHATLYMFPQDKDADEIITVSETPDQKWLEEFVRQYS